MALGYYAVMLGFSLVMLVLSSIIMAKLNDSSSFQSSSNTLPSNYATMKNTDLFMILLSILIMLWSGYMLYSNRAAQ